MAWYLTVKMSSDAREHGVRFGSEADADTRKTDFLTEDPEAEITGPFEEADDYLESLPRVQGRRVADAAGTEVDFWTDGVTTPRS